MDDVLSEVQAEALNFLKGMVRIPTENPPGLNYESFTSFVTSVLEGLGYYVEVVEVRDEKYYAHIPGGNGPRPNVVASLGRSDRRIVFNGHYDVVPAAEGWSHNPYEAQLVDGRLYGRGASDMKSGIAAMVYAVELLRRVVGDIEPLKRVVHHIVTDEETVGNTNAGTGYLSEHGYLSPKQTSCVVFTEPFGLINICVGHRGALWGKIEAYGEKSHGGFPAQGADAIKAAVRCVECLYRKVEGKAHDRTSKHHILPSSARKPSVLVGLFEGGSWANTVADRASFWYVRRLIPEESLEEARREVEDCIRRAQRGNGTVRLVNREVYATPAILAGQRTQAVKAFELAVRKHLGKNPKKILSPGTFDMRFVSRMGIDAVGYGPGRLENSHATDEWVDLQEFNKSIKIMAHALLDILRKV